MEHACMDVFDELLTSLLHTAICHVGFCLVLARQTWPCRKLTSATHSLINFPAIVSHDYSVISLALNNIFCPKKLSIQRVYTCCLESRKPSLTASTANPRMLFPYETFPKSTCYRLELHLRKIPARRKCIFRSLVVMIT